MSESQTVGILRTMAWERTKGELEGMRNSYLSSDSDEKFERFSDKLDGFVKYIEDYGLQE